MGLFGKKVADAPVADVKEVKAPVATKTLPHDALRAIVKPRITEKAAILLEKNVYTFEIMKGATKYDVRDAIKALYKVTPTQIRIVNREPRHFMSKARGRNMMVGGLRKAYVYLKKGDRIDLV